MGTNTSCTKLCTKQLTPDQKNKFRDMIEDEYVVNWLVDNLPAATRYRSQGVFTYHDGFLVGLVKNGKYFVHNHYLLDLQYHENPEKFEGYRVVGFEVEPSSR